MRNDLAHKVNNGNKIKQRSGGKRGDILDRGELVRVTNESMSAVLSISLSPSSEQSQRMAAAASVSVWRRSVSTSLPVAARQLMSHSSQH